jgi:hypothetical protein
MVVIYDVCYSESNYFLFMMEEFLLSVSTPPTSSRALLPLLPACCCLPNLFVTPAG